MYIFTKRKNLGMSSGCPAIQDQSRSPGPNALSNGVSPKGVKKNKQIGMEFVWPKELFHSRPLRPIFCSPFVYPLMRNVYVTSPACVHVFVSSWCPVVVRSSQCSLRQSMVFVSTGMVCFSIPRSGFSVPWLLSFIDWSSSITARVGRLVLIIPDR